MRLKTDVMDTPLRPIISASITASINNVSTNNGATPNILAFLPLLYVGWADATLTQVQVDYICQKIQMQSWLQDDEKAQLHRWLDPTNPPSAKEMKLWLHWMREAGSRMSIDERTSLAAMGMEMARIDEHNGKTLAGEFQRCSSPEACAALDEVEIALGIVSREVLDSIMADDTRPILTPTDKFIPSFDIQRMRQLLDGDYGELKDKMRMYLSDPAFALQTLPNKEAYRTQVWEWTKTLARQGIGALSYPEKYGGADDLRQYMAAFEVLAQHDLSLAIKFGVQFGLFGSSIHLLGTERHYKKYLADAGTLDLPGCFAMTETGHGSNVRDIETLAYYDPTSEEFVVHTPHDMARKDYIGNAARDGRMATVFTQLEVNGERHGVHALLVPLRDREGHLLPGIRIEDAGEKMGLNGVDNGRIWFNNVRVPRENLLNRFADITPEGEYESPIAGESKRFFTMVGTLVGGRVGIATAALSASKVSLAIAIKYANKRRQFGPPGKPETLLLDYQTHQRRLIPRLATVYALDFAIKYLAERYTQRTEEDAREVETLAAAIKAYTTWANIGTIQECREACGGQGYLAVNRFAALKADTDIFATFEGDNTVLMQLVAKACFGEFKQQFNDMTAFGLVRYIANQAGTTIATTMTEMNPIITRTTDEAHLLNNEFHLTAFRYREQSLVTSLAKRFKYRLDNKIDSNQALIETQTHMVNVAYAYVERIVLEQFIAGIADVEDPAVKASLQKLLNLYALSTIEKRKGWYLEQGYMEGSKTKAIRRQVDKLGAELRNDAEGLVDAFGIPAQALAAPIAL